MANKLSRRKFVKNSAKGAAFIGLGGYNLLIQGCSKSAEYDLLITGGIVYDGMGSEGREVDIAVKGDKIIHIGEKMNQKRASIIVNAKGLAVSPGFIDAHTHTDIGLLVNPKAESYIRQGITTDISGNCGSSPFPVSDASYEEEAPVLKEKYGIDMDWRDIKGFFNRIEEKGSALNYASLVGQGDIRGKVVGLNDQEPTAEEIIEMRQLVAENMSDGALGLSTGLEYPPGSYAKTDELIELCSEVARFNGVYATHVRNEADGLLESIDEAITIARKTGVSLQISHLKVACPKNWGNIEKLISKIENAKNEGINILADRYPYTAGSAGLSYFFPLWAQQGTTSEYMNRLKNSELDNRIRTFVDENVKRTGSWDKVIISDIFTDKNKYLEGRSILESATAAGKKPYDFMRDLIIEEENRVGMVAFMMSEENLKRILNHPLVVLGSDGNAVAPYGLLFEGKPHPRYYGSFPRVLGKYVREEKIFKLEEAINKMTFKTAEKFGLKKRGQILEGCYADFVVFDPDKIIDKASWENPHQYSTGIDYVIVNGKIVIKEGDQTGELPGKVLRKGIM